MRKIEKVTWEQVSDWAYKLSLPYKAGPMQFIYGVPRGGVYVASALLRYLNHCRMVEHPSQATLIVDDLVDSGKTRERYQKDYPHIPFVTLLPVLDTPDRPWYEFPWERMNGEQGPNENIRRVLEYIGEDPNREGLLETPHRVVKSWSEIYSGYGQDPAKVLKTFEDGACDQMVVLKDIEFYSCCEHHMQPFFGRAHIGYIPNGRVVGISKLARLLEIFSRRLQIQERIGQQVTEALMTHLMPKGCGCILEAKHFCMTCRGVNKQNSAMVTSSLAGLFLTEPGVKQEFFRMAGL